MARPYTYTPHPTEELWSKHDKRTHVHASGQRVIKDVNRGTWLDEHTGWHYSTKGIACYQVEARNPDPFTDADKV